MSSVFPQRNWDILLICGASGAGKSSVSYRLARYFGVALIEVDDFQVVLETMTTPEQQPVLHFWNTHPDPSGLTEDEVVQSGIAIGRAMLPALEAVIANHLETARPAVMEGDFILPELAAFDRFGAFENGGRVRAVVISEPDADQIAANYLAREPDAGDQSFRAAVSARYDHWLCREAQRAGIPCVASRPWPTLFERTLAAVG